MDILPVNFGVVEIIFNKSERSKRIQKHLLSGGQIRIYPEKVRKGAIEVDYCAVVF